MQSTTPGRIITFYSYKGGTGRSMALANVAWILASNGKRVLALDWDLEAPGLHSYFYPFLVDKEVTDSEGVIDFVIDFAVEAMTPPENDAEVPEDWHLPYANILRYATALDWEFGNGGVLDFVPAGRQGSSYSTRINSFNWEDFYDNLGGGVFLESAKEKMKEEYDYVLIDSRTGVSDTSGICTVQMPDALVICFTLNNQSIKGAAAVANSIYKQRKESDFEVFPVAMRIENAEQEKLNLRWEYAKRKFALFPTHMSSEEARSRYWTEVAVPYVPYYAYEEVLAAFGDKQRRTNSLLASMERLTNYLVPGSVGRFSVGDPVREEVLAKYEGREAVRPSIDPGKVLEDYLDWIHQLLAEKHLRDLDKDDLLRIDTRARTLTAIGKLDNNRKRDLLRFLHEANLIKRHDPDAEHQYPVIGLDEADLREANLEYIDLSYDALSGIRAEKANLRYATLVAADLRSSELVAANLTNAALLRAELMDANLSDAVLTNTLLASADLSGANLRQANLSGADLHGCNLRYARLSDANLNGANLNGANLYGTDLSGADMSDANMAGADLSGAHLKEANLRFAKLNDADLNGANLNGVYLSQANLSGASLHDADLSDAYLIEADLSNVDLSRATATDQQLAASKSLAGATMPDGERFKSTRQRIITASTWAGIIAGLLGAVIGILASFLGLFF